MTISHAIGRVGFHPPLTHPAALTRTPSANPPSTGGRLGLPNHVPPCRQPEHQRSNPGRAATSPCHAAKSATETRSLRYVYGDDPYSERQFRALKYRTNFPDRLGCLQDSRAFCQQFFRWYNEEHRHSWFGLLAPAMVHSGQLKPVLAGSQAVLDAAYLAHPDPFDRRPPRPLPIPSEVWINEPAQPGPEAEEKSQQIPMLDTRFGLVVNCL